MSDEDLHRALSVMADKDAAKAKAKGKDIGKAGAKMAGKVAYDNRA